MKPSIVCLLCLLMVSSASVGGAGDSMKVNVGLTGHEKVLSESLPMQSGSAVLDEPKVIKTVLKIGRGLGSSLQLML